MELFRREALDGQDRLHGDIVFVPQISWRMLGLFFAASLAVAALYLSTATFRPATAVAGQIGARNGAVVAAFHVPASAAEATLVGEQLRLTGPGIPRHLDARVIAVRPAGGDSAMVVASLSRAAPHLAAGTAVRTALPARQRSLAAWLGDALFGSGRR